VTSAHADRRRASNASSTGTAAAGKWAWTSAAGAPNAIGGVGCPVAPISPELPAPRRVALGLGQIGPVPLGGGWRPVLLHLAGALGVVPAQLGRDERGDVVGGGGRGVSGEEARPGAAGEHVVERARHLVAHGVHGLRPHVRQARYERLAQVRIVV